MAAGISVAVTKKLPEEVGLAQDNCIFLGAVRPTQNRPVVGIEYRSEQAEPHALIAMGGTLPSADTQYRLGRDPHTVLRADHIHISHPRVSVLHA